ncbi:probable glutamate receptor [Linepithema humile]|uniref:probable glutamate receptor n=1 Tax=Linepithema humile TaxID=83485 RepID=UPI00351F34F1
MRLPLCLMYSMLFCILLSSAEVRFNISVFVNAILSIRRFYSAATVMFAHPGDDYKDYGDLEITHLVHGCYRGLSQHNVMTVNMHFKKMERSLRYQNQIVQPITIVIMPNFEAYQEFAEATKTYPMSFSVWFVLFLYPIANDTHNYCLEPIGNPFNIAFNTQMLVLCYGEDFLWEWYSVKGETVKTSKLAVWDDEKGFVSLTNMSLYDRRKDLEGVVLRATVVKDVPILSPIDDNYVVNLYNKVLEELTNTLNCTLNIVSEFADHGTYDFENNIWSGVMGEIVSGRADIAIADMSMTSLRIKDVDFTLPLIVSKNSLFIKEPGTCGVKWLGYFQVFNLQIWIALITVIAITPLLLLYIKYYMQTFHGFRHVVNLISDNYLCIWGIFCLQSLIDFPSSSSLRLAYFTIILTAVLIMTHYSAALVSFLTTCPSVLPFRTIDEFANDGTYELIVPRDNADYDVITMSEDTFSLKLKKLMKDESKLPATLIDGFVQVCNEKNVAFMELNVMKKSVEVIIPCKLSAISTERIDNLGIVLSKGNPYTALINYHLEKFLDNGIMMRLRSASFSMQPFKNKAYEPVRIVSVIPILIILCGGFILSIFLFLMEKIFYRYTKSEFQRSSAN